MKIRIAHITSVRANALLVALVLATALGIGLASFLAYASNQNRQTVQSQRWNLALPAAEAGIEEAMSHLFQVDPKNDDDLIADGWTKVNGKASLSGKSGYYKSRTLSTDSYFEVMIDKADPPVITSVGYFRAPLSTNFVRRAVEVTTTITNDVLSYAVLARKHAKLQNDGVIDSYDSKSSKYSTGGKYDPAKNKDNGKVGSSDPNKNKGDVKISKKSKLYGEAFVGSNGKIEVKDDATMGNKAWIDGGNEGAQSGTANKGLTLTFPDVKAPYSTGIAPTSGKVDGIDAQYLLDGGNFYLGSNVDLSKAIYVTKNSTLYINGSLKADQKIIVKDGASFKLYVGKDKAEFKNMEVQSGNPADFAIFGLEKMHKVKIEKSSDVAAVIYAPRARIEIKGGGELIGACVGKCVHIKDGSVHYDENLSRAKLGTYKFVINSWKEI